jgi:hypothetical protein
LNTTGKAKMKTYKLYLAKPLLVFYLVMFTALVFVGVIGIIFGAVAKLGSDGPPVWVSVIWCCIALFVAYMWLRIPFEIKIHDDTMVEFRSVLRRTMISPVEIKSVRAKRYSVGFVDVVHQKGKVHLLSQMDGFHDFITTIKSLNPAVKVEGC